ncbi:MAG: transcription antitermination factor NusB [Candidatus Cloacimonetes bacterium]|nr:transcription antitermination factor NusB [Candidatus Cloacimonadota bacterium]
MGLRRKSREIAFKVLYSLEYTETDELLGHLELLEYYPEKLKEVLDTYDRQPDVRVSEFAEHLIRHTIIHEEEIDRLIEQYSKNWSLDRLAVTDKSLLRMGIYEILFTETPAAIIMDEVIEIAKRFCSESSSKFINGVLNAAANYGDTGKGESKED